MVTGEKIVEADFVARSTFKGKNRMKHLFLFMIVVAGILISPTQAGSAPARVPQENVKVLTDISITDIRKEMQAWTKALGVQCNYCHEGSDFPSDANPKKETARKMATMLKTINKDFLDGKATCMHCHRGTAVPELPQ
jgi:hypothetical protein